MRTFEYVVGFMLVLVLVYLFLVRAKETESIFKSLGGVSAGLLGTLQGRSVSGLGGVTIGR